MVLVAVCSLVVVLLLLLLLLMLKWALRCIVCSAVFFFFLCHGRVRPSIILSCFLRQSCWTLSSKSKSTHVSLPQHGATIGVCPL